MGVILPPCVACTGTGKHGKLGVVGEKDTKFRWRACVNRSSADIKSGTQTPWLALGCRPRLCYRCVRVGGHAGGKQVRASDWGVG